MHIFCTISDKIICHLAGRRKNPGVATTPIYFTLNHPRDVFR